MTFLKKYLSFLLAAVLCMGLTACGGSADEDWRNSGDVIASGTITRSDGDVDVLVTMDDNNACFYWDDPEHTVFDSVTFPFTIPNARECFEEISFADVTANGESDVEISFTTDSGTMYLSWLWDLEGYYVFRRDLSTYTIDGADFSKYVGLWQWADESLWLNICEDESWTMLDDEDNIVHAGSLWLSETGIVLYFYETGDVVPLDVTVSGELVNIENEMMFVPVDSLQSNNGVDLSEYVGLWEYVNEDTWIRIYENETWECIDIDGYVFQSGTLSVDSTGITFYSDDFDGALHFDRTVDGDLIESENDGMLVLVDSIPDQEPYFTRNGLEINAAMDMGTYLLENGVCSYANLGDDYNTGDCYWEVIKNYDQTHDGIREIQFDAICYIPRSSIGTFNQKFITSINSELYDFYSGMWFTAAADYGDSTRGENYYLHTINWNGQSKTIEFAYSTDWQDNVGDWGKVLTKSYVAYLPEGYDGLVFAAEPLQDNYEDYAKAMQLDSISPEASIMDIDLVDPEGCLFFSICD